MLSASDKERYARQLLLADVGAVGQAKLCAAQLGMNRDADGRASEIAGEYLRRAGVTLNAAAVGGELARVATSDDVAALAGDAALREAAAWLAGSLAAVEAMKQIVGAGQPATLAITLGAGFRLAPENR